MPPKHLNYTHFADLVRSPGERTRFHWFPGGSDVRIIHVDSGGVLVDDSTVPKNEARTFWTWLLKAGWEPYGAVLLGRPGLT